MTRAAADEGAAGPCETRKMPSAEPVALTDPRRASRRVAFHNRPLLVVVRVWLPWVNQIRWPVRAFREDDEATVEAGVVQLRSCRRIFAPFGVGGPGLRLGARRTEAGLRRLASNQLLALPATWICAAMTDFKAHVFHGKSFHPPCVGGCSWPPS